MFILFLENGKTELGWYRVQGGAWIMWDLERSNAKWKETTSTIFWFTHEYRTGIIEHYIRAVPEIKPNLFLVKRKKHPHQKFQNFKRFFKWVINGFTIFFYSRTVDCITQTVPVGADVFKVKFINIHQGGGKERQILDQNYWMTRFMSK